MQVSVSNSKIRRLNFWPNIARLYIEISMPFRSIALEWISLNFLSRPFRPFIRRAEREGKKENQLDDNRIFDSARFYFSKSILSSGRNIYFPLWQRRNGTYPLLPSFFFFLFPFSEVFDIYFLAWRRFHRSYRTDRSNIHRSVQLPSSKPVIISYSRSHRIAVSINVT